MGTSDAMFGESVVLYVRRTVFRELFVASNVCESVVGIESVDAFEERLFFAFADDIADRVGV